MLMFAAFSFGYSTFRAVVSETLLPIHLFPIHISIHLKTYKSEIKLKRLLPSNFYICRANYVFIRITTNIEKRNKLKAV